jgi:hypothetical protein
MSQMYNDSSVLSLDNLLFIINLLMEYTVPEIS